MRVLLNTMYLAQYMRLSPFLLVWLLLHGSTAAEPAAVSVADFAGRESFTSGIQEAIDALPPEGGVVTIPPGKYVLRRWWRCAAMSRCGEAGRRPFSRAAKRSSPSSRAGEERRRGDPRQVGRRVPRR